MGAIQNKIMGGAAAILSISTVFAFLGVYDSNTMPFLKRILFWGSTISTGAGMGILLIPWVFIKGPLRDQKVVLQLAALSAIASIPVVAVVAAFSDGFTGGWPLYNWPLQYFLSFAIAILINTGGYIGMKAAGWIPDTSIPAAETLTPVSQFLERLPAKYHSAELYAVSSEDHYIRVHTDCGEELVLMRLADALRELSDADGLQTHRSWWVARIGVAESVSKNGKYSLILKTGTNVPISRSFSKTVRDLYFL